MRRNRDLPPLLVRADADPTQGTGHVMRCIALARAWHEHGGSVCFLSTRPASSLRRRMETAGATVIEVAEPHPAQVDLATTRALIERLGREKDSAPWMILDGYHFDPEYQSAIRRAGCRLLVVDDNAHLPCYDADILLNHGVHAPRLDYRAGSDTWLLLGTRYALLRAEFEAWRGFERTIPRTAKRILVTLGGADADNITAKVIEALSLLRDLPLEIQILTGALNPHFARLRRAAATVPNMQLHIDVADPAPMMAWADIAVAAGGTTAWELAFMQTPALLLVLAQNQIAVAEGLAEFGAARSLARSDKFTAGDISEALRRLIDDEQCRRLMADRGKILVDGMGPSRVLAAMKERERFNQNAELTIRYASFDDELLLWQWANDPATRRNSFNSEAISWDDHEAWCARTLASPDCRLWIMRAGDLPVGQIRYERTDIESVRLSFSVAPGLRGMKLGTRLLQSTIELAARELAVRWIEGVVLADNEPSLRVFLATGFEIIEQKKLAGRAALVFRRCCAVQAPRETHVASH